MTTCKRVSRSCTRSPTLAGSLPLFERAVKEYPDYYEAYAQMGMAYMNLKDSVNSEQALRKSIEISKERYADAYAILALLCSSDARYNRCRRSRAQGHRNRSQLLAGRF